MKKEKLTLKKLHAQLELLLKNSTPQNPTVDKGVKTSIFNTLSSSYTGGISKLSSILVSLKKVPIIGSVIKFLKLDKLSFLGIFVLVRKVFLYFNAFLGIYFMLKLSGISLEAYEGISSVLAGIIGMVYNYLEVVKSFSSKALNSTLEFFNYKIISNSTPDIHSIPQGKVGNGETNSNWFDINQWTSSGGSHKTSLPTIPQDSIVKPSSIIDVIEEKSFSLRKTYMDGQSLPDNNTSSPWYKDLTNWYYIIGGVAVTVSILGLGYIAYSYYLSVYFPDTMPPGGEDLGQASPTNTPASPTSDTSTIMPEETPAPRMPIKKSKGIQLPPIETNKLPPVPKVETPLNPWNTPAGWKRPGLTPVSELGFKPGLRNPLSPEKVTETSPSVITSLPPTPTAGPTKAGVASSSLEDFINNIDI